MSAEDLPDDRKRRVGAGPAAVVYWLGAGAAYGVLGVLYPPAFLLGFQESLIFVFLVTLAGPHVLRRFR
jgi:hypothetical protein